MSFIHVQQIKARLEKNFSPLVDLSDCRTANESQKEATALTVIGLPVAGKRNLPAACRA